MEENKEHEAPKLGRPSKASRFKAYEGKESLPKPIMKKKIGKDGKEYQVMQKVGEPRFAVYGNKLIAYYRKPHGISKKLFRVLRPKMAQDKAFRELLKKAGIPGA